MALLRVPVPQQQSVQPPQSVSTSLRVDNLDATISEAQLSERFGGIGPLVSIKVCRDAVTGTSQGYAHVNYNNVQDASRALMILNYNVLEGKPMVITFFHHDPTICKSGTANIFIKNLDKTINDKALKDTFSAFGSILSCKVATDPSGQSKGYGFVHFQQSEAAQLAIEKVNGTLLNNKQVYVGPFIKQHERHQNLAIKYTNVYVKNLSETTTDEHLKEKFGSFGKINSAVVTKDGEGKSKCFGFVNFEHADDAAKAVEALNGKKIDDKEWYVGKAQKKSEREAELRGKFKQEVKETSVNFGVNLYLKNLDDSIHDQKLQELFSEFGNILSCKVMKDPQGRSKGSGVVAFSVAEEASRALSEMNGKMVGSKPIHVAFAQRIDDQRARLQNEAAQFAIEKVNGTQSNDKQASVSPFIKQYERDQNLAIKYTNVYVKNLSETMTDTHLKEKFGSFGKISSAVVTKDGEGKSKCFGFVNFEHADDAAKAVEALNGKRIDGKVLYAGRAQKKSEREAELRGKFKQVGKETSDKFEGVNLYLKNLDDSIHNEKLRELFSEFGNFLSCKVVKDPQGQSKGSGFVAFTVAEEASRANLDKTIGNKALHDTFASGSIHSCKVATDSSGQSKGYDFEQSEAAELAIEKVNGVLLNDKQPSVGPFIKQHERDPNFARKYTNVYVKNLLETTTDEYLKEKFGCFGKISSAVVTKDGEGKSKCFGFVNFEHADDAAKAVEDLNGKRIDGKEWYVGRAQKKSEREAELRGKFKQERKETSDKFEGFG